MKFLWLFDGSLRTQYLGSLRNAFPRLESCFTPKRRNHDQTFDNNIKRLIEQNTEISNKHMTPELKLHLITPNCKLWWSRGDNSPFTDPYWAFYWPGGQVISRYILDNPDQFKDKCVLDVGAGCAAAAIAAAKSGAKTPVCNDIDRGIAAKMNAELNSVSVHTDTTNMIGCACQFDLVLLGDMFYDATFTNSIIQWVTSLLKNDTEILIGDPGRLPLLTHPMKNILTKVVEYKLPFELAKENNGFSTGTVWKLKR